MLSIKLNRNKKLKILCLGAHCDDIEIGCGGSILKLIEAYNVDYIKWIVFASTEIRKNEAENCANNFLKGINSFDIEILEFRDGFLPYHAIEVKEKFECLKREFIPDIIFSHYRNDRHQDHRLISDLTWNTFRNHLILEYEIPKYDGDLDKPNFFVELDEDILKKKIEFLLADFKSQITKHWFDKETFYALPRIRGMESATRFAEAFHCRKLLF